MLKTLNNSLIVIDVTQWDTAVLGGNSEMTIKNLLKALGYCIKPAHSKSEMLAKSTKNTEGRAKFHCEHLIIL